MNTIKSFRAKYGLTQQVAATILGISHSHLALAETDKRSLPFHALSAMADFEIRLEKSMKKNKTGSELTDYNKLLEQRHKQHVKELTKHKNLCDYRYQGISRKLKLMEDKRNGAMAALQHLARLRLMQSISAAQLVGIRKAESDNERILKRIPQMAVSKLRFEMEGLRFVNGLIEKELTG